MSDVLVLCYHAVSDGWTARLSVTPHALERQLEALLGQGYVATTFERAVFDPPAARTLAVTFDDAYRSVAVHARPILESLGVPGTTFVPTLWPERRRPMAWPGIDGWLGTEWEGELHASDWEELGLLAAAGWEIGSHTRSHPHLTSLADGDLAEELERSREDCEAALGRPCRSLAYPYGDVDPRVVAAARRAGYACAAALPRRFDSRDPLCWPRVGVYHRDDLWRFRAKTSSALRRLRGSRAWDRIDSLRRGVRRG